MLSSILKKVLCLIKPTKKEIEEEKAAAAELVKKLKSAVPKEGEVVVAGSIAKSTFLTESRDVDLFILLPKTIKKNEFENVVKNAVNAAFPSARYELKYAEHPYARVYLGSKRIDVVPAYNIKNSEELMSAVDRSILHTHFILKKLKKRRVDDVLLLKKFLKANDLYGAEIKVSGFSGYLCELLVLRYGSFVKTMRAITKWKPPVFIDIKKYYGKNLKKGIKNEKCEILKRFRAPLIVIDPVDKERNVAAAVSEANLKKLCIIAKRFLRKPSANFFLRKPLNFEQKLAKLGRKKGALFVISMAKPRIVDDILWGQLKRLRNSFVNYLRINDFKVCECIIEEDKKKVYLLVVIKQGLLPEKKIVKGPLISMKNNAEKFRKAHKGEKVFLKNRRLFALVKRPMRNAHHCMREFFETAVLPSHFEYSKNINIEQRNKR